MSKRLVERSAARRLVRVMEPRRRSAAAVIRAHAIVCICVALAACGDKQADESAGPPPGPGLGVLELPISLRSKDAAPGDARKVEVGVGDLRVDDKVLFTLENGRVPAAEKKDGVLPKLAAALQSPARAKLALHVHSSLPYESAALVLNTAAAAGMHQVAFQVRPPGATTQTGWLAVNAFQTTPRTDDEVAFKAVDPRKWDEFTGAWQAIHDACRAAQSGSCAYVQGNVAKGGNLKIVLHASGQGVNVNFFRAGLTPEELAAEEAQRKAELATKKEDFVQGRGVSKTDLEKELLEGDPADQALFQFRAKEALELPSPVSEVMQPLCGTKACGAVISADENTLMVRVVSLIGAAFADGSAPPTLAFELPWTEKPKPAIPAAAAADPSQAQ
jgi:hypothetical protein